MTFVELFRNIAYTNSYGEIRYGESWNNTDLNWTVQNEPEQPATVGIEIYRGINLVYRHVEGQAGFWGAKDNQSDPYYLQLKHNIYWTFYPNLEPPNGWYDCKIYGTCY